MKAQFFSLLAVACLLFATQAYSQAWRIVFQPDESLDFYVAQNADGTFAMISEGNESRNLFLRVTNEQGRHTRFYFEGRNYLQLDVPEGGYVALMSEAASEKIQYIHASQKVERLKFTDTQSFFKAANGNFSGTALVGQKVSPKAADDPNTLRVSEDRGGDLDADDNFGFDPNRNMRSVDQVDRKADMQEEVEADEVGDKAEASEQSEDYQEAYKKAENKVESLTARLEKLRKTVELLQGELDNCTVERKKLEIGDFNPISFIAGTSTSFFNMASNNEADTLEKITGLPTTLDFGISFNGGRFHKAIMLSAGVMPVNMTPKSYVIEPVAGLKTVFMSKKYAVSARGLVNADMSYMSAHVGFGVWVLRNGILMAELGGTAGDVNLLYTKQVAPSGGISFIYNFRKPKN